MPKPEEIDAVLGDEQKPEEKPSEVSVEEYRKAVQNYENLRSMSDRKDAELARLRKLELEKDKKPEPKQVEVDDDLDDILSNSDKLKEKLISMGFAPIEEVEASVTKRVNLENQIQKLQSDIKKATTDMPFVNERAIFDKIQEKRGNLSVSEAIQLLYPAQLANYQKNNDIPETDGGGRTIKTTAITQTNDDAPVKRGFRPGTDFRDFITQRASKTINESLAGK
jgi:hypothetical protein